MEESLEGESNFVDTVTDLKPVLRGPGKVSTVSDLPRNSLSTRAGVAEVETGPGRAVGRFRVVTAKNRRFDGCRRLR